MLATEYLRCRFVVLRHIHDYHLDTCLGTIMAAGLFPSPRVGHPNIRAAATEKGNGATWNAVDRFRVVH